MKITSLSLGLITALVIFLPKEMPATTLSPVWSDEFNQPVGAAPDDTKWAYALSGDGWGNHELETYTNSRANSSIVSDPDTTDGKALAITAVKDAQGHYSSARLETQGKFSTAYGRIEARLKTPNGKGFWPAFWLLGAKISKVGWPACGEIDILESVDANPTVVYGTLHGPGYSGNHGLQRKLTLPGGALLSAGYHLYAVDWSPGRIAWSVDGKTYHVETASSLPAGTHWVFDDSPFFIVLNLAIGGDWPGNPDGTTTFPQSLMIDYVRVYRLTP